VARDTDGPNLRERASHAHKGTLIDLQGHQAAEQIIDTLLAADENDPEYEHLIAKAIGLGQPILTAVVRRLDSSQPRQLAVLGTLIVAYPFRVQAVQTLVRSAADRRKSDHRRMGAMLVLNQFLGVPPSDDFLPSLHNPAPVAVNALIGTLHDCAGKPEMLLGYFRALSSLPVDILYAMLNTLANTPGEAAVAALRILAVQPDPDLMKSAIDALISRSDPQAIRALIVLEPNLPPEAAHTVSRHLHKLRLSGNNSTLLEFRSAGKCRALLGPIDGKGRRLLWLVVPAPKPPQAGEVEADAAELRDKVGYIAFLLKDSVGVLDALGAPQVEPGQFPAPQPVGSLLTPDKPLPGEAPALLPRSGVPWCLEAPFDYGLRIIRDAVLQNWLSGTPLPLDYQLLFDLVWEYGPDLQDDEEVTFPQEAVENENDLLCNSIFDSWYLESNAVYTAAQELLAEDVGLPVEMTDQSWRALLPMVIKLVRTEFTIDTRQSYSERLRAMAGWLQLAGLHEDAKLAASAARTMSVSPPETNIVALSLVQKGLLMAVATLLTDDGVEV